MDELDYIKQDVEELKRWIEKISATQATYVSEHHKLEKQIIEMRADIHYIRKSSESLQSNINKIMFIVIGGFASAMIAFIVSGGMSIG